MIQNVDPAVTTIAYLPFYLTGMHGLVLTAEGILRISRYALIKRRCG